MIYKYSIFMFLKSWQHIYFGNVYIIQCLKSIKRVFYLLWFHKLLILVFLIITSLLIKADKIAKYILTIARIISKWMKTYWDLRKDTLRVTLECWVDSLRWHSAHPYLSVPSIMELSEWDHFVCPFLLLKKRKGKFNM